MKIYNWDRFPLLLTTEEACLLLGCTAITMRKHILSGDFAAKKIGREWRIDRDSLRNYFSDGGRSV